MDIIIPGTPQAIFNLIFASRFLEDFLRWEQGFMEIQISGWHPRRPGSLLLVRSMTYINPFSDPVCSKQIIYELKDYTLHFDFDDYVSILTVMRIPGIPSENVFLIKVKTCIMWASATASRLIVTIAVEWTGMSFIESIIDKSTINNQIQYYIELEDAMRSYISAHRTEFVPDNVVGDAEAQSWLESVPIRDSGLQDSIPVAPKRTSLSQPADTALRGTLPPPLILVTRDGATSASQSLAASITGQPPNRICSLHTSATGDSSKDNSRFISEEDLGSVPIELTGYELSTSQYPTEVTDDLQPHSPRYVASVMYDCLIQHGCPDLTASIDPLGFSSSVVAEGGFGDIWAGRLYNTRGRLAIKLPRFAPLTEDATKKDLKRITREIYNWSKLDHENVNKLMGVTMFRERLAMVSEWMEHGNLRQYLSRNLKVNRRALCVQIARGVAYLHEVNMVHGDLKACNILVSSTGILKITDFDYSISSECSLELSVTTRMGGGTYRWMAPELLLDEDPPQRNTKTDIYALGMTFLETITNANPYSECQHESQIYGKLSRNEHPKRPEEYLPATEWGTRMWSLLLQCWDFNPVLRPTANIVLKLVIFENET
ncbi:Ephrin type-A receptor 6 [Rhizoctonia solani]|uniref:Ephrin type-A receptor 6 n=1 Tax=Rhizoctonia solani TaxID=456999 RepID=A0A0K6FMG5_9AGAM|nr:Ephrin type-A receptor 6 [Rhizoctonia solani]